MPRRWGVWFAVEGDLRFASHRDLMRAIARALRRAHWPVAYSHGFNPRPLLSLPCPLPVGVAADRELMVVALDDPPAGPENVEAEMLAELNRAVPPGLRFQDVEALAGSRVPAPREFDCVLPVGDEQKESIRRRLDCLSGPEALWAEREGGQRVDLRGLVRDLRLEGGLLRWTHVTDGRRWARPAEILAAVGLADAAVIANVTRTEVRYAPVGQAPVGQVPPGQTSME